MVTRCQPCKTLAVSGWTDVTSLTALVIQNRRIIGAGGNIVAEVRTKHTCCATCR